MRKLLEKIVILRGTYKEDHEPIGKYECDQCGKTFALRLRLGKHQESHESLNT